MPARTTGLRRRAHGSGAITPEQIECLISGDWEYGALIPRRPEFGGRAFRDLAHAEQVWRENRALVLRVHREGWKAEQGAATLWVNQGSWLRDGRGCWASETFDKPEGGP